MTSEDQQKIVARAAEQLHEHFDVVLIQVSHQVEGKNSTLVIREGRGNWYGRVGMCKEFIDRDTEITAVDTRRSMEDDQ